MNPRVLGLAEMMNFPAVCNGDAAVLQMIEAAQLSGKVVDGHAPQLNGKQLNAYIAAGVNSDHECTELCEAYEKLSLGQYIMIRQGTAGKILRLYFRFSKVKPILDVCLLPTINTPESWQ